MTIHCVSNPLSGFMARKVGERGSNNSRIVTKKANSGIALGTQKATGSASHMVVVGCKALLHACRRLVYALPFAYCAHAILIIKDLVVFVRLNSYSAFSMGVSRISIGLSTVSGSPFCLLDCSARSAMTLKTVSLSSRVSEVCDWLYFLACAAPLKPFGSFWPSFGKVVMPNKVIQRPPFNPSKLRSISWCNACLAAATALAKPFLYIGHYDLLVMAGKTTLTQVDSNGQHLI